MPWTIYAFRYSRPLEVIGATRARGATQAASHGRHRKGGNAGRYRCPGGHREILPAIIYLDGGQIAFAQASWVPGLALRLRGIRPAPAGLRALLSGDGADDHAAIAAHVVRRGYLTAATLAELIQSIVIDAFLVLTVPFAVNCPGRRHPVRGHPDVVLDRAVPPARRRPRARGGPAAGQADGGLRPSPDDGGGVALPHAAVGGLDAGAVGRRLPDHRPDAGRRDLAARCGIVARGHDRLPGRPDLGRAVLAGPRSGAAAVAAARRTAPSSAPVPAELAAASAPGRCRRRSEQRWRCGRPARLRPGGLQRHGDRRPAADGGRPAGRCWPGCGSSASGALAGGGPAAGGAGLGRPAPPPWPAATAVAGGYAGVRSAAFWRCSPSARPSARSWSRAW